MDKSKTFAIIFTFLLLLTFNPFFTIVEEAKAGSTATFGRTSSVGDYSLTLEDQVELGFATPSSNGTADNITAYIYCNTATKNMKACLYWHSNRTFIASTLERSVLPNASYEWVVFTFDITVNVKSDVTYRIGVWSEDLGGNAYVRGDGNTLGNSYYDVETYGTFPPLTATSQGNQNLSIYCSYTLEGNNCPMSSAESPSNKSTGVSIDVGYWNVTINDADGNTTTGNITCSNGNWSAWTSQANGTRSCSLSTLSYSTNYTVWVNFSDDECPVNETYWFITEPDPMVGTNYYVKISGDDSKNGLDDTNAWATVGKVNTEFSGVINAGDNIYFNRGDTFTDTFLNVQISGASQSNPTIFGAYGTGALPEMGSNVYGIYVYNSRENITIQNLRIDDTSNVGIYLYLNIRNVIVENCEINDTRSVGGIWVRDTCEYIFFRNNTLSNNVGDSVLFQGATYGLIENNTIEGGTGNTHSTLVVRSSSYVIVRNNTIFDPNPTHWGGNTGDGAQFLYATDHCVFENNIIYDTDGAGFKIHGGNTHIIRNNQIRDCGAYGMGAYTNSGTPSDIHDNIWYHNTIYNSGTGDYMDASFRLFAYDSGNDYIRDNIVKNNILFKCNQITRVVYLDGDTGCEYYVTENTFDNNIFYHTTVDQDVCFLNGTTTYNVSEVESTFPSDFMNNIQLDPEFANVTNANFTLNSTSPCIDAGGWLTTCNGGGTSSTTVTVHNAGYFCDGFGLIDGDDITIGTDDVTVTDVNYGTNVLTIDTEISWDDGNSVSCVYSGNTPDIGANEYIGDWSNTCPVSSSESPVNQSTGINANIGYWNVSINDIDGNTTTGNITCNNGNWSNWSNQGNGIRSCSLSTLSAITNYTVWLNFSDAYGCDVNETYWFVTEPENLSSPSNLVASNPTANSISLEWTKGYLDGTHIHDILYVDNFSKYTGNPLFDKSDTGSWANYGIRENALLTNSTGHAVKVDGKYVMYFNGRTTSPVSTTRIGRANSTDGINWNVANNYVFNDTGGYNYTFIGSVIQLSVNSYIMYYGSLNATGESVIKYATSTDSVTWTVQKVILNETDFANASSINIPSVVYFDSEWHMVLEIDSSLPGESFRICYANSSDGETWIAKADAIYIDGGVGSWDDEDSANPSLYKLDTGKYVMFYNGNGNPSAYDFYLGILHSTSITSGWTSWKNNPILETGSGGSWEDERIEEPRIYMDDIGNATLRMWYFGLPTQNGFRNGAIGYATCNETSIRTIIRYSTSDNLTTYTDGSFGYNSTNSYTTITGLNFSTKYYFRAWNWNETYGWNATGSNTVNLTTTANTPPVLSVEIPTNASVNVSRYPQLSITVTDADGNNSNVYWYTNASGSWYLMQTNSSVLNEAVYLMNFTNVSAYSTTYYWRVSANDTNDNTTEIYHFTTLSRPVPVLTNPSPPDGSSVALLSVNWSIEIYDTVSFNWTIECDGQSSSDNMDTNGTFYLYLTGLDLSTHIVYVNVTNGDSSINDSYVFTVVSPSGIVSGDSEDETQDAGEGTPKKEVDDEDILVFCVVAFIFIIIILIVKRGRL